MKAKTVEQGSWDPRAAYMMSLRAARDRQQSTELAESLRSFPDSSVNERSVTIPGNTDGPLVLRLPQYVGWLEQQADLAQAEIERFGGQHAVQGFQAASRVIELQENGMPADPDLWPSREPLPVTAAA